MEVEILSRKLIAPSSPRPLHLQKSPISLSFSEQLAPSFYVPRIFNSSTQPKLIKSMAMLTLMKKEACSCKNHFPNKHNPFLSTRRQIHI
jgi:hypothetical protein|uniref:Uncharacterized protein n=1 Tax=Populus trichocarpa TaxID=3694 RepID=A0A3N7FGL6_POPTR